MCSKLSASHCLILRSFPAVKKRWDLGTNCRYITLKGEKSIKCHPSPHFIKSLTYINSFWIANSRVSYFRILNVWRSETLNRHMLKGNGTGDSKGGSLKIRRPPVIVCEERLVAVPEVQTPDFHIPVSRAGCYQCSVLRGREETHHITWLSDSIK